jgi:hypothetical protein
MNSSADGPAALVRRSIGLVSFALPFLAAFGVA